MWLEILSIVQLLIIDKWCQDMGSLEILKSYFLVPGNVD